VTCLLASQPRNIGDLCEFRLTGHRRGIAVVVFERALITCLGRAARSKNKFGEEDGEIADV
jgi:hypothetical protein